MYYIEKQDKCFAVCYKLRSMISFYWFFFSIFRLVVLVLGLESAIRLKDTGQASNCDQNPQTLKYDLWHFKSCNQSCKKEEQGIQKQGGK